MLRGTNLSGFGASITSGELPFPTITGIQHSYFANVGVTGDPVTQWDDQTAAVDLVDGAGAPDFDGSIAALNNKEGILFDGTDDQLIGTVSISQPYHIFAVMAQTTWTANDRVLEHDSGGNAIIRQQQSGGAAYDVRMGAGTATVNQVDPGDALWHAYGWFFNAASSYATLDGADTGTANPGTTNMNRISLASTVAGGNYANIGLAEFFVLDQEIDAGEEANWEAYVTSRYDIAFA